MPKSITVSLDDLLLDPNNYRIRNAALYRFVETSDYAKEDVQTRTAAIVSGEKDVAIRDLMDSFEHNGYLPIDQIQVRPFMSSGKYLVVEGNRRVTALKRMAEAYRTVGAPLGKLSPSVFANVPVVVFDVVNDADALVLMGLKHISGNLKWSDYNQAMYIYDLFDKHHLTKDEICDRIAVSKMAVGQSLRALALVGQYKESDYGDQFTEEKFSLFREIVRNSRLKEWIGWNEERLRAENSTNITTLFSLMSHDVDENGESDDNRELEPAIVRRSELRQFSEMIGDSAAMKYFIDQRNLAAAYARSSAVASDQSRNIIDALETDSKALAAFRVDANGVSRLEAVRDALAVVISDNETTVQQTDNRDGYVVRQDNALPVTDIRISDYKAFHDFSLNGLSKVNIVAGANNTGKTTLLEAVYLLVKQCDVRAVFQLVDKRGKASSAKEGYAWSSAQISEFHVSGTCGGQHSEVRLTKAVEPDVKNPDYLLTVDMTSRCGDLRQQSSNRVSRGFVERDTLSVKYVCPAIFNTPFYNNEHLNYRRYYLRCSENKAIDRIVDFVRNHILFSVEKIYWDDEVRRFKVSDAKLDNAVDLSQYGEGMQRIFLLALLFASVPNGILLIDEIENAIHPGLLPDFTSLVAHLADEFNVQVIATTHSKECIDGFVSVCREIGPSKFSFIGLVNDRERGRLARVYSGDRYLEASEHADVDLRGVV